MASRHSSTPARAAARPRKAGGAVLGFDFGTARIGVAVGQTLTATASPLVTLEARGTRPDWPPIDRLVEEWRPVALLVGLPRNMDGSDSEMTARAARFMRQLQSRYGLPTHGVDERLTTFEAEQRLSEAGLSHDRQRQQLDQVAAQLIIETWYANPGAGA